ncbi:MAG: ribosomal protein S18-alanine N-acetyltransferase [Solobacterium sp.]|nr:ribosomal protein S18-alanine N-acetyltransferase [Solobacterium sp.]
MRKMTDADLPQVLALENELFPASPWNEAEYRYELHENPFSNLYVVEEKGAVVGYIDYWFLYEKAQIANIGVAKHAQHRGIAQMMLKECVRKANEAGCETLSLEVRYNNLPAIRLYRNFGFIDAAMRRNYYENGDDAILMVLPLGGME